jgi:hypothetical protein
MVKPRRIAPQVDQDEVVEVGIEGVTFQPGGMIDKGTIAAKLGHEYLVPQMLRGHEVRIRYGQPQGIRGCVCSHCVVSRSGIRDLDSARALCNSRR